MQRLLSPKKGSNPKCTPAAQRTQAVSPQRATVASLSSPAQTLSSTPTSSTFYETTKTSHLQPPQFSLDPLTSSKLPLGQIPTNIPTLPPGGLRFFSSAVTLPNGSILVGGGSVDPKCASARASDTIWIWDPSLQLWTQGPHLQQGRSSFALVLCGDDVYAIGGQSQRGCALDSIERIPVAHLTLTTGVKAKHEPKWTTLSCRMSSSRVGCAAVAVSEGSIVVLGGHDNRSTLSTVDILDTYTNKLHRAKRSLHTPRCGLGAAVVDHTVYAMGGYDGSCCLDTIECWDISPKVGSPSARTKQCPSSKNLSKTTTKWRLMDTIRLSTARWGFGLAVAGRHCLVLAGGFDGNKLLPLVELLDFNNDQPTTRRLPDLRGAHEGVAVTLLDGRVVVLQAGPQGTVQTILQKEVSKHNGNVKTTTTTGTKVRKPNILRPLRSNSTIANNKNSCNKPALKKAPPPQRTPLQMVHTICTSCGFLLDCVESEDGFLCASDCWKAIQVGKLLIRKHHKQDDILAEQQKMSHDITEKLESGFSMVDQKLESMMPTLARLEAKLIYPIPCHFVIVPRSNRELGIWKRSKSWLSSLVNKEVNLLFVCAHSSKAVSNGPVKLTMTREWIKTVGPALVLSLRLVSLAGKVVTGIPIDFGGSFVENLLNTNDLNEMTQEIMNDVLKNGEDKDLIGRLNSGKLNDKDIRRLSQDCLGPVVERAMEDREWMNELVRVRKKGQPGVLWVLKEYANDPSYELLDL